MVYGVENCNTHSQTYIHIRDNDDDERQVQMKQSVAVIKADKFQFSKKIPQNHLLFISIRSAIHWNEKNKKWHQEQNWKGDTKYRTDGWFLCDR